jgi:hypothetical protein
MAVTAKFVSEHIEVLPNVPTAATLRLYNGDDAPREVSLSSTADLGDHLRLEPTAARLEPNQIADVTVTIEIPSSVESGTYQIAVEADINTADATVGNDGQSTAPVGNLDRPDGADGTVRPPGTTAVIAPQVVVATATVQVVAHCDFAITLQPSRSRGSGARTHVVRLVNTGNLPVTAELAPACESDLIEIESTQTILTAAPGVTAEATLRVVPTTRYWSGPTADHEFTVHVSSTDGRTDELSGIYQQRPRVPNWLGPAAAGAFAALLIGAIVWFAFLRPWVNDTAEQAAADAIENDRAALRDRIAELEAAAAEAKELPLGTPTDLRLEVAPTGANTAEVSSEIEPGTVVSITDVVFQNPTGAVGTVTLRRDGDTLLSSELANFRDFDLHFVAPFVFDDGSEIVLEVECRTPGAGLSDCPVAASLVGFVDEAN